MTAHFPDLPFNKKWPGSSSFIGPPPPLSEMMRSGNIFHMRVKRQPLHSISAYLPTSGAGIAYPSASPEFTPGFSGVRGTRSLVLYVCFVDRCLSFCTFSFGHCVVCSSSIYGLCLALLYLQTLLPTVLVIFCSQC